MNTLQRMLPALFVLFMFFYLLPFFGQDTGSFMVILLLITPAACLVVSLYQGYRTGFHIAFPLLAGILFAPTLVLYYNYTAWVYILIYALIATAGMALGSAFHKHGK